MPVRVFNRLAAASIVAIFGLSLLDAWKTTEMPGTSVLIALAPTLVVAASCLIGGTLGRKKGRPLLLKAAALSVCLVGLVAYAGYAVAGPGNPDTAGQMHVFFFPVLFGLLALAVMGGSVLVAYVWPKRSDDDLRRSRQ